MQAIILVLNKTDHLEDILREFAKLGIKGATVLDSVGMGRVLTQESQEDLPLFGSLKMLLNENRPYNKTIFTVLKDEQVPIAIDAVKKILGDLKKPNVGVLFTVPVNYVEGFVE